MSEKKNKKNPDAKAEGSAVELSKKAEAAADAATETAEKAADAVTETAEKAADAAKEGENYSGILGDYTEPEEEEIGETPKPEDPPKEKKKGGKKALVATGIAASVVLVGCLSWIGIRAMQKNKPVPVISSDNYTITKEQLSCYYQDTLDMFREYYGEETLLSYYQLDLSKPLKEQAYPNNDGSTWFDNIIEDTISTITQQMRFAEAGKAAGYELPEKDKEMLEEKLKEVDLSKYGEGVTLDDVRTSLYLQAYSASYYNFYIDSLTFTDEEAEAYYAANTSTYNTCGVMGFSINYEEPESSEEASDTDAASAEEASAAEEETSAEGETSAAEEETAAEGESSAAESESTAEDASSESSDEELDTPIAEEDRALTKEEALALANELKACKDPAAFEAKVRDILNKTEHLTDEEMEYRISTISNNEYGYTEGSELGEWAFNGGAKPNDTKVIEATGAYYVYMLTSEPGRNEDNVIDVRHILFSTDQHTGEDGDTDAALEECRKLAADCLAEWEAGDRTEDSFAELATAKTEDTGSQSTGGLYSNVYRGQTVPTFNDWCFDASRQPGDTGIVETTYGVHVMYFVKDNGPKWKVNVTNTLKSQAYENWITDLEGKYAVNVDTEAAHSING
ncbi:MAG: peptidyl-prolyl cis-trans isomerase [Oscillospiraceae bacterium]|nr:peptidyl-prolyl cis-trans isomerase [Oscillospiraceae bacterium]